MRPLRPLLAVFAAALLALPAYAQDPAPDQDAAAERAKKRANAQQLFKDGNRKEAFDLLTALCHDPASAPEKVAEDLKLGAQCLRYLRQLNLLDAFREKTVRVHSDWRVAWAAAETYQGTSYREHTGYMVAGEFWRGRRRGGGRQYNVWERDRVRGLQLMQAGVQHLKKSPPQDEATKQRAAQFYLRFADLMTMHRGRRQAWRLQYVTDLSKLPDVEPGYGYYYYGGGPAGAPVDAEGKPVFHDLPKSWAAATSDGQRWRWLLLQAAELGQSDAAQRRIADFAIGQFGVQTMRAYSRWLGVPGKGDESGPLAVHTLKDHETIAKLASGIRRFELPEDYRFIGIYKQLKLHDRLGAIYENRRQYPKAVEQWKLHGNAERVSQITGNWGTLEGARTSPAGQGAKLSLRFRNAKRVKFTAHAVDVEQLMKDVKEHIRSNPPRMSWRERNVGDIGWRIVHQNQRKYLKEQVADWSLDLKPLKAHFDRTIDIATPLQKAGAYLVTSQVENGNISRVIVWVADTVIVRKPLDRGVLYYVADARSGRPVAGAKLDFFGYRQNYDRRTRRYHFTTSAFDRKTDAQGMVAPTQADMSPQFRWLVTARTDGGRMAFTGFDNAWFGRRYDRVYNAKKVFALTDRPVYRPKHTAKYKLWVRQAQYDMKDESRFAGRTFTLRLVDPRGQKAWEKPVTCDAFGGIDGEWAIPADATLGNYRIGLIEGRRWIGGGSFRIEEYKKPEFEVTVEAPSEPVKLGEKLEAKISARYYFGAPVTQAKVKYKVLRYSHDSRWYPTMPWDWFYGNGYWWFAYDYSWYPGFAEWGCRRPIWSWWGGRRTPPEVVAQGEAEIGKDGKLIVPIDTAPAKLMHGDQDHRYQVTAEVRDASRRTIVGTGQVLVSRKAFKVYTWLDRGYYKVGDTVTANFSARRIDGKPVKGDGVLRLLQVSYDEKGTPKETEVQQWKLPTNADGRARQQLVASKAGQYRLSYTVDDGNGHKIEGGFVFVAKGEGDDGRKYRFNHLELVTDKKEYRDGDTAEILVNTDKADSTVLVFSRASNGAYLPPKVMHLKGKSAKLPTAVTMRDMPNFFVEALTVANGKVHTEIREVVVPPVERVLDVKVTPSAEVYEPGADASVQIEVTDKDGKPFQGQTTIAVYDKSLEYIGGSGPGDIKSFYWKWRRYHRPATGHTLSRGSGVLIKQGEPRMATLGVFGHLSAPSGALRSVAQSADKGGAEFGAARGGGGSAGRPEAPAESRNELKEEDGAVEKLASRRMRADRRAKNFAAPGDAQGGEGGGGDATVEPKVRKNFADTAFWAASVMTDAQGKARVSFPMPESLTSWRIRVWAVGHGTRVGHGESTVVTKKKLLLRMQAPRFFVERDEVVLSANVHSYLEQKKTAEVVLELDGPTLELVDAKTAKQTLSLEPGAEGRIDWRVRVLREGTAVVRMKALTDVESDAAEMTFPAVVHGMTKQVARSTVIAPEADKVTMRFDVPKQRRIDDSKLTVNFSPTLAGAMVDAVPYLASYPYGCTEQTLSRFLPSVMTQRVLQRMGVDLAKVKAKKANLNPQELGDPKQRAAQWKRWKHNPVWDTAELNKMVKAGIDRLVAMQVGDGGWGWFSGYGERSYPHTTAYVVHGLQMAAENDVAIPAGVTERGVAWLERYRTRQLMLLDNAATETRPFKRRADNMDAFVQMVLLDAGKKSAKMRDYLYRDRIKLSVYGKALLALSLHREGGQDEKLAMVRRNIEQFLVTDDENQTAYLKLGNERYWWAWYGSEFEAHAYYLKLLCRVDPKGATARGLVKYLLNNRKHATYWNSTRDTAICLEAFAEYLKASGEDKAEMEVDVIVSGRKLKTVKFTPATLFEADNTATLVGDAVESGELTVELVRRGKGPLYANAYLSYFTLEDHIEKTGLELKVERKYFKLVPVDKTEKVAGSRGQVVDQKVEKWKRVPLANLSEVTSGGLVEVMLVVESKNDYEYILIEDPKAAGCEPYQVRSGYTRGSGGGSLWAYMELRDQKVCFFVRRLARGKHSISYRYRAEVPGRFAALPTRAYGMYAPELAANSDEFKLVIGDSEE